MINVNLHNGKKVPGQLDIFVITIPIKFKTFNQLKKFLIYLLTWSTQIRHHQWTLGVGKNVCRSKGQVVYQIKNYFIWNWKVKIQSKNDPLFQKWQSVKVIFVSTLQVTPMNHECVHTMYYNNNILFLIEQVFFARVFSTEFKIKSRMQLDLLLLLSLGM